MKSKGIGVAAAFLLLIWIGVILNMSSQSAESSGHISRTVTVQILKAAEKAGFIAEGASKSSSLIVIVDQKVRSLAHVSMYFLLGFIFMVMLWVWGVKRNKRIAIVFLVCLGLSIIDEINQMQYYGRNNSGLISAGLEDIIKDTFGICSAIVLFIVIKNVIKPSVKI